MSDKRVELLALISELLIEHGGDSVTDVSFDGDNRSAGLSVQFEGDEYYVSSNDFEEQ